MMENLDLSVIILSYNTKEITNKCLGLLKVSKEYCEKKFDNKVEVIVLDNGSSDGSPIMIRENHPWVNLITSFENTGFSKGNNIAAGKSKNPYILLLNSDAYVEENTLYKALAYFRVNLNCDVLGCKLKYATGKLQPSAGSLPNLLNVPLWISGLSLLPILSKISPFHPRDKSFFRKAHQVGWVTGAFLMLKRKVFEATGGFDEKIFMYLEEVEFCKRVKDLKFKIWYVPTFEAIHLHGASSSDNSLAFLSELKGIRHYFKKHYKSWYWYIKIALLKGLLMRIVVFTILGKRNRARVYREGLKII